MPITLLMITKMNRILDVSEASKGGMKLGFRLPHLPSSYPWSPLDIRRIAQALASRLLHVGLQTHLETARAERDE